MISILRANAKGDVLRIEGLARFLANQTNEEINIVTKHPDIINSPNQLVKTNLQVTDKVINLNNHTERIQRATESKADSIDINYLNILNKTFNTQLPLPRFNFKKQKKEDFILYCPEAANITWSGTENYITEWTHRVWYKDNFAKLISRLNKDYEIKESCFLKNSLQLEGVENVSRWWTDINSVLENISKAKLVICNDSLLFHLAVLADVPVLVIAPLKNYFEASYNLAGYNNVVEFFVTCEDQHECKLLDHKSYSEIHYNDTSCIHSISVESVYNKTKEILNNV